MKMATFRITLVFGLLLSFVCGCRPQPANENCLLITLDTIRADHLSCYDPGGAATPHLDSLAKEGVLFERCYSPIPITLPAHGAMFYSRLPHELGVWNNGERIRPDDSRRALPELFAERGFRTAAFVSMGVLQSEYGLDRGIDEYVGSFPREGRYYLTAEEVNARVLPWLRGVDESRFFLWVHYSDPHAPYHPPGQPPECRVLVDGRPFGEVSLDETIHTMELPSGGGERIIELKIDNPDRTGPRRKHARFRRLELRTPDGTDLMDPERSEGIVFDPDARIFISRQTGRIRIPAGEALQPLRLILQGSLSLSRESLRARYRQEVEYMDDRIGLLLNELRTLGLFDRTHIVVVGDHGEGLGEYRKNQFSMHFGHIRFLYDVYLRVPFIVRSPAMSDPGKRVRNQVSLLDVAPITLGLFGWDPPPAYRGENALDADDRPPRIVFQSTFRPESDLDRFALLDPPYHLIMIPSERRFELYDVNADPGERTDLYSESGMPGKVPELRRRLERAAREALKNRKPAKKDSKTEEMLKALGYIR